MAIEHEKFKAKTLARCHDLRDQARRRIDGLEREAQRVLPWLTSLIVSSAAGLSALFSLGFLIDGGLEPVAVAAYSLLLGVSSVVLWRTLPRLFRSNARQVLQDFQHHYRTCSAEMPMIARLIAEDDVWHALFSTGVANPTRLVVHPPRTADERIVYAAVLWGALQRYRAGQRSGFDAAALAGQLELVDWLSTNQLSDKAGPEQLARFCAIYDFFEAG